MFGKIALCDVDDTRQRFQRVTFRTQIEGNQVGLAIGQHRDGRRRPLKMPTMVQFGQSGLHGTIAAIDDEHLWLHAGNHFQRFGDLANLFDFVMEYIRIFRAIVSNRRQQRPVAGGIGVRKKRD